MHTTRCLIYQYSLVKIQVCLRIHCVFFHLVQILWLVFHFIHNHSCINDFWKMGQLLPTNGNKCVPLQEIMCTFFCNRRNSFLSFGGHQLYNSEALPFTYDQYVVIELADKLYNSVTVCFCVSPWIFIQINNFFKLPAPGIEPLTLGLQIQRSTPTPWGTHRIFGYLSAVDLALADFARTKKQTSQKCLCSVAWKFQT